MSSRGCVLVTPHSSSTRRAVLSPPPSPGSVVVGPAPMAPLLRKFLCLSRRVLVLMHELQITQILTISQLFALERCSFRLSAALFDFVHLSLFFLEIFRHLEGDSGRGRRSVPFWLFGSIIRILSTTFTCNLPRLSHDDRSHLSLSICCYIFRCIR